MNEQGKIRFLLNQEEVELDFHQDQALSPTTTLLQFLRSNPILTGTKEGCAEGDCGACTVVLMHLDPQQNLICRAVDSCLIFLPMLHHMAVITVEGIGSLERPHPVQEAMVACDGSQCGYCTPGIVMSLYAMHQNHQKPHDGIIKDALTGNLCRCTGYRSILEAAQSKTEDTHPAMDQAQQQWYVQRLEQWKANTVSIVTQRQKYFKPARLDQALELKGMYPQALFICGATDIALKVTKNHEVLTEVIDLSAVEELTQQSEDPEELEFGAGLTLEQVKQQCKDRLPALYDTLAVFGSLQIRNLATLGGNIGSASPIGDTLPILMAYRARVNLVSPSTQRSVLLTDFITGYRQTTLEANEIIKSVSVPLHDAAQIKWYKISKRKDLDISTVSGGFRIACDSEGLVQDIVLYFGGMAAMTKAAHTTQEFLLGKPWNLETVTSAQDYIDKDFTPISDARAYAASRSIMARNLLLKFWTDTEQHVN